MNECIKCDCGNEISYTNEDIEKACNTLIWGRIECNKCGNEYKLQYNLVNVNKD